MAATRVALIDRDGTLNLDKEYVTDPKKIELISGVADAVADLKGAGFLVAIVSNQSAVGRGWASVGDVDRTNAELLRQLSEKNPAAVIDQIVYCTHAPQDNCNCRKPQTGLLALLRKEFQISPETCWVFGDKWCDIELGLNLGLDSSHCCLVMSGNNPDELERAKQNERGIPLRVFSNLQQAVAAVLREI